MLLFQCSRNLFLSVFDSGGSSHCFAVLPADEYLAADDGVLKFPQMTWPVCLQCFNLFFVLEIYFYCQRRS